MRLDQWAFIALIVILYSFYDCGVFSGSDNVPVAEAAQPVVHDPNGIYPSTLNIIGGDGHEITLYMYANATRPTYQEVIDFIKKDQTDDIQYMDGKFVCADYAETACNNAEKAGIDCGYVSVVFDNGDRHACNAFNTTDRGMIFIDCTGDGDADEGYDKIVTVEIGKQYTLQGIDCNTTTHHVTFTPHGIVTQYDITEYNHTWYLAQ